MNSIIQITTAKTKGVAFVEPNVPMDKLVKATLQRGMIPQVVMEFPGITVGGGISGLAGESSSHKYGYFHNSCLEYEVITADGQLRTVSTEHEPELFRGIAGAYGTIGVLTGVKVKLIPAKRYVQLTYLPVESFRDAVDVLNQAMNEDYDYIDGIMFSETRGVVMVGRLSNEKVGKAVRFTRPFDEWFYLHVDKINMDCMATESIPIWDYLFRYNRGAFWEGERVFRLISRPFNRFTRFCYDHNMRTRKLYQGLHLSGLSQKMIIQDLILPSTSAEEFMKFISKELQIFPLWLLPVLPVDRGYPMVVPKSTPLIDIGVWGGVLETIEEAVVGNRLIEREVARLGGAKVLYANNFYKETEFWQIYDKKEYMWLRKRYGAEYLPDVYQKVVDNKVHKIHSLNKTILKMLTGRK